MRRNNPYSKTSAPALVLMALLAAGCGGRTPSETACEPGENLCFDDPTRVLVCAADGSGFEVELCPTGSLCFDGVCAPMVCVPGSRSCEGDGVATCLEDGSGWGEAEACGESERCSEGACGPRACAEGELRCGEGGSVEGCAADGSGWLVVSECPAGTSCVDAVCLPDPCEPGDTECGRTTLFECTEDGWQARPCGEGEACVFDRCVECVSDSGCEPGESCVEGACVASPPRIVTEELPAASAGSAYSATLEAVSGLPPYTWSIVSGALPAGITLSPEGQVAGTPAAAGVAEMTVRVEDAIAAADERELELEVLPEGPVRITTRSLPRAEHGMDYEASLAATGGSPPYAWQLLTGDLPAGLVLLSRGQIAGAPEEIGTFPVTFRVLDISDPPGFDTRDFELVVAIAPLEIVGDQEYDLLFTKVEILPLLVPLIPYATTLQARGGLTPYDWSLEDPPAGLGWLIAEWGLPDGMTLDGSGRLSGWVTDVSAAQRISIPFGPELAGFFFYAGVEDSQDPADRAEAIFCIPTVPL